METFLRTSHFLSLILIVGLLKPCPSAIIGPKIRDFKAYVREGDLNLGFFSIIHNNEGCDGAVRGRGVIDGEEIAFALDVINRSPHLLPNISLGMVMVDSCYNSLRALARSVYFLPETNQIHQDVSGNEGLNLTLPGTGYEEPKHYEVVGTIGLTFSNYAVVVSALLSAFHIPVLSLWATSDELSDKSRFPYFMRMVLPDRFAAHVLVDVAAHYNWTYVSVVYSEGPYGENGGKQIEKFIKDSGLDMCVAFSHRMSSDADDAEYMWTARRLKEERRARVVMMISLATQQEGLFTALEKLGFTNTFLFLTGDLFIERESTNEGSIFVHTQPHTYPGYKEYLEKITPWSNPANPWLPIVWQDYYHCSWNVSVDHNQSCYNHPSMPEELVQQRGDGNSHRYDAVFVYAHALHNLIKDRCPEQFKNVNTTELRKCTDGKVLIQYMKNVSFEGYGGRIEFDENGDILGELDLEVYQYSTTTKQYGYTKFGRWNRLTDTLYIDPGGVNWNSLRQREVFDMVVGNGSQYVPRSVCSMPCPAKHFAHMQELPCCWDCQACRDNEILAHNHTGCLPCPEYLWPDPDTATYCQPIVPYHLSPLEPMSIGLWVLALLAVLLVFIVASIFLYHGKHKLIRATSKGLSYVILFGTLLSAFNVIFFVIKPTQVTCVVRMLGFHYGVNLLYTPLMVKTMRIYRIFSAGKRSVRRPRFVSSTSQAIITLTIVSIQSLVIVLVELLQPVSVQLYQPVRTNQYVELHCAQSLLGFLIPVAFNLLLIIICATLGYMSRKLPENFNESWYIFISVATTLFMWMVLLPTYFTAFYTYQQAALLAFCLILNAFITLVCLFVTKIYAIMCLEEKQMLLSPTVTDMSRVYPMSSSQTSENGPSCSTTVPVQSVSVHK